MTRRFTLGGFVAYVVILGVIVLLAALWLDAERRADRAPTSGRVRTITSSCTFYEDGSATCPPGVFATTTTEAK